MRKPEPLTLGPLLVTLAALLALSRPGAAGAAEAASPAAASPLSPALRASAEGRVQAALDILNRLAAGGYRTPELYDLRAQLSLVAGDRDAAERDWRRAEGLDATYLRPRLALGQLYAQRGLWPDAIRVYREVLVYRPRNVEAILGLVDAFDHSGRKLGARKLLEAAGEAIDDRRLQERWAQAAAETGRPEDAERALARVAAHLSGPAKRDVLRKLASLYLGQGRTAQALAALQEAVKIEAAAGAVTLTTYDLAVQPADQVVTATVAAIGQAVQQLDESGLSREEAFARVQAERQRLAEITRFVGGVTPPEPRRVAQVAREYAYSLADEAAVKGLSYVDLGEKSRRDAFRAAREAARDEIDRLGRTASSGS